MVQDSYENEECSGTYLFQMGQVLIRFGFHDGRRCRVLHFYVDLICSNKVWRSVEKHFSNLTVDFNMEAAHEISRLKRTFEDKEYHLIKTDLG